MKPSLWKVFKKTLQYVAQVAVFIVVFWVIIYVMDIVSRYIKSFNIPVGTGLVIALALCCLIAIVAMAYNTAKQEAVKKFYANRIQTSEGFLTFEEFVVQGDQITSFIMEDLTKFTGEQRVRMMDALCKENIFLNEWDFGFYDTGKYFLSGTGEGYESVIKKVTAMFPDDFKVQIPFDNPYIK